MSRVRIPLAAPFPLLSTENISLVSRLIGFYNSLVFMVSATKVIMDRNSHSVLIKLVVLCLSCLLFVGYMSAQKPTADSFVKGELLVKFSRGVTSKTVNAANRELRAITLESLGDIGWQRVKLPKGISIDDAIEHYKTKYG